MADDGFNMSLRKFLKRVGVTSQQAIEEAARDRVDGDGSGESVKATVVLSVPSLGLTHTIEGEIELDDAPKGAK